MSGLDGLNPDFASALQAMMAEAPGLKVNSGFRSVERQQQLWDAALKKYGDPEIADNWVARPGKSNHNPGGAVDLGFANDAQRQWVHDNAARFGLAFPMSWENWHIELAKGGGVGADAGTPTSAGASAPALGIMPPAGATAPPPPPENPLAKLAALGQRPAALPAAPPVQSGNLAGVDPAALMALLNELQGVTANPLPQL